MKRIGTLLLAAALIFAIAACGSSSTSSSSMMSTPTPGSSETIGEMIDGVLPDMDYSLLRIGLGVVSSTAESVAAKGTDPGNAKLSVTVCALALKPDGMIADIRFDTVEAGMAFDAVGALTGDATQEIRTRREQGDEYGMKESSGIGKEWYEQVDALESWMRGKSVVDVLNMKVTLREGDGMSLSDEPDLKTSVTITVNDQLRALEKAYSDAQRM